MNIAFKHYGTQPSTELEREALIIQSKYNLTDLQMAGLLQIYDFFQRIVLFDTHISSLRISENKENEKHLLPQKTRDFFSNAQKCSDLSKYFNPHASRYFQRFADRVLSNISKVSDYVATGLIERIEDKNIVPIVFEYQGHDQ